MSHEEQQNTQFLNCSVLQNVKNTTCTNLLSRMLVSLVSPQSKQHTSNLHTHTHTHT